MLTDVRSFFRFLRREGCIVCDPAAELEYAREPRHLPRNVLTPAEARRIIEAAEPTNPLGQRDRTILEVFYSTGIRRNELRHLKPADVNAAGGLLRINDGKGAAISEPLESFDGWWEQCLLWETARPYFYMRTTADGRALVGGEDDPFRNPERRDRLVPKKTEKLAARFREMFPRIDFEVAFAWAGTFGETKDGLAYIGAVPELPHCLFALGFGGNGITLQRSRR